MAKVRSETDQGFPAPKVNYTNTTAHQDFLFSLSILTGSNILCNAGHTTSAAQWRDARLGSTWSGRWTIRRWWSSTTRASTSTPSHLLSSLMHC